MAGTEWNSPNRKEQADLHPHEDAAGRDRARTCDLLRVKQARAALDEAVGLFLTTAQEMGTLGTRWKRLADWVLMTHMRAGWPIPTAVVVMSQKERSWRIITSLFSAVYIRTLSCT